MLFFLLLKAAPAMNHPSADDDNSPRKKWLEVDSQILNALFCVTGFGLAPWRFRDLYYFIRAAHFKDRRAMDKLAEQNKAWFRPPAWAVDVDGNGNDTRLEKSSSTTFTGGVAPPTALWKLAFTIWMMVLNTAFQAVLCYYMWGYNRIDRPVSFVLPFTFFPHPLFSLFIVSLTCHTHHRVGPLVRSSDLAAA